MAANSRHRGIDAMRSEGCGIAMKVSDSDGEVRSLLPFEGLRFKQDRRWVNERAMHCLILLARRSLYTRMIDGSSRNSSPIRVR